jgi:hypothetical protein
MAVPPVEQRSGIFLSVAEPINQEKIENLVAPIGGRRVKALPPRESHIAANARGDRLAKHIYRK